MKRSQLKRRTLLRAKTGFQKPQKPLRRTQRKKTIKGTRKKKTKRISPILGINEKAESATYKQWRGTRYKGVKGVAWTLCSLYIRHRDNFECSTCSNKTPEAQQAGHYWPMGFVGSNNKLSWDEMNIHCQCKGCNENYGGLQKLMADYIDRKYGKDVREDLDKRRWKSDPVENWEEVVIYYEKKLEEVFHTH